MDRLDIGIDLGTSTIIVYLKNKGIVFKEPSVVAINMNTGEVRAVGEEAYNMVGKTPANIRAIRPMYDGVISDIDVTSKMLNYFIKKACGNMLLKPRIAICIPTGITEVETRAIVSAAIDAGARKVYLVEEPMAAAIGAGIDISKANGEMIVDIGGGTTDIAVISLNGIAASDSIKIAGNEFDEAIMKYIKKTYNMLIGDRMAERIKKEIGCVYPRKVEETMDIKGRDLLSGLPIKITISSTELLDCLLEPAEEIISSVLRVFEKTPPELSGDISMNGITLTGGGGLIYGLCELITERTGIKAKTAENPIECVAIGTGMSFNYISQIQDGIVNAAMH